MIRGWADLIVVPLATSQRRPPLFYPFVLLVVAIRNSIAGVIWMIVDIY